MSVFRRLNGTPATVGGLDGSFVDERHGELGYLPHQCNPQSNSFAGFLTRSFAGKIERLTGLSPDGGTLCSLRFEPFEGKVVAVVLRIVDVALPAG